MHILTCIHIYINIYVYILYIYVHTYIYIYTYNVYISKLEAFICHYKSHFYCIRRVCVRWYNLDSLKSSPSYVGDNYLNTLLLTLTNNGASIFVVHGPLLQASKPTRHSTLNSNQYWLDDAEMIAMQKAAEAAELKNAEKANKMVDDGDDKAVPFGQVFGRKNDVPHEWPKNEGRTVRGGATSAPTQKHPHRDYTQTSVTHTHTHTHTHNR
eukprot:GHVR01120925.1.p1 GENE.GHVR01120925.1~~GHVR01120925.1.p1  ORF type:complete len:218 (+),score=75.62 GHVR01120925.1:24-656(+)